MDAVTRSIPIVISLLAALSSLSCGRPARPDDPIEEPPGDGRIAKATTDATPTPADARPTGPDARVTHKWEETCPHCVRPHPDATPAPASLVVEWGKPSFNDQGMWFVVSAGYEAGVNVDWTGVFLVDDGHAIEVSAFAISRAFDDRS
jgi:hypothetical protein